MPPGRATAPPRSCWRFKIPLTSTGSAIGDKESIKWLESVAALSVAREAAPQTTFVRVGDRAADVYELFAMERAGGVELLVRASWNRVGDSEQRYFWETVRAVPALGTVEVSVPRWPGEPIRRCTLGLRSMPLTLKPPQARKRLGPVELWAVLATEVAPSPKGDPIEWLLLTTVPTPDVDDVIERVHWPTCRWTIEVWHNREDEDERYDQMKLEME